MTSKPAVGSAKSIGDSRAEALQALLDSLAPGAEACGAEKLQPDQVRKISDKLGELLGEDAMPDVGQRNEKGELLNEEGLPIIDIVEPVSANDVPTSMTPTSTIDEGSDVIPLWALSPAEKARRRAERDRLFDLLEEEERVQQEKEEEEERERFKVELEKRKQAAEAEMNALKKAREVQKKMGKALLRNLAVARDREEQEKRDLEEKEKQAREERKKLKPRKSVSFADLPPDHEYQPANSVPMPAPFDWGDVAPAKLHTGGKNSVLTKTQMDKGPMRMNVVERVPGIPRGPKSPPPPSQPDSDDESEPGSPAPADSDEGEIILSDHSDSEDHPPPHSHDDSDESDYGIPEDKEPVEWDDEGYDFARHQREIALAYYEKRATVGAEALAAMRNHEHTEGENEWDQPVVPLEASLASSPPKPSASQFKTSRASVSSTLPSQSLGTNIIPASQSSTLKSAVRLGKLEDGNLVGGEAGESDDEMDPAAKEMLEMLKKGEVVNVGPSAPADVTNALRTTATAEPATSIGDVPSSTSATSSMPGVSHAASKPKPSKVSQFKMSLTEPSTLGSPLSPGSGLTTPTNSIERSSPKLPTLAGTPIAVPTKTSRVAGPSRNIPAKRPAQMPSMIVQSPSFPAPGVVASPSTPNMGTPSAIPAFNSMIIESPSFLSPTSTAVETPDASSVPGTPSSTTPVSASVLERRPVVVTQVRESASATSRSVGSTPIERKKVSRFLAERS